MHENEPAAIRKYLVTLNVGANGLVRNSRDSFRAAATRWGAEFVEVRRAETHGFATKLRLDQLMPQRGRIVFLDRDIVVRDDCPSLFDIVPAEHFGYVAEDQGSEAEERRRPWTASVIAGWARAMGVPVVYGKETYFNSGVMVFDMPLHAHVFARARKIVGEDNHNVEWHDEQGCVNVSVHAGDVRTLAMPPEFNLLLTDLPRLTRPTPMTAYLYHFNGMSSREKMRGASLTLWNVEQRAAAERAGASGYASDAGVRIRPVVRQPR